MEVAILGQQSEQADEQARDRRCCYRQQGDPAAVGRNEQGVVQGEHGLDETDGDHGNDAADNEAEHSKYGDALEQSMGRVQDVSTITPPGTAFVPAVLPVTDLRL